MIYRQTLKLVDHGYSVFIQRCDFLVINCSLAVLIQSIGKRETIADVSAAIILSTLFIVAGKYTNLYSLEFNKYLRKSVLRFLMTAFIAYLGMALVKHTFSHFDGSSIFCLSDLIFHLWFFSAMLLMLGARVGGLLFCRTFKKKKRIAIIGLTPAGIATESALLDEYRKQGVEIKFYDDLDEGRFSDIKKSPYGGKVNTLLTRAKNNRVDHVYVALPMVARSRIKFYLDQLSDTTVDTFVVPDFYRYNLSISQINTVSNMPTFSVFSSPFTGTRGLIKRVEDILIGSLITLMISPVLLAVAIGVKLSSPGPILFKQDRYGLGGKKIKVWKFRSMKVMENEAVVKQATKNDPRVTRFGALIRRTSLDELPQFINVLQGAMSIVGPRPHAVAHNEQYRTIVDNYMIRHKIKPGITGWAQINGYRGETQTVDKMEKRVQYDIQYMQNWSLWVDLKIIFITVFKGFMSETAY